MVEICAKGGIPLAVNQNMRYDQSMRALKTLLARGELGEPVLGTIEMRAIPTLAELAAGLRAADAAQYEHSPSGDCFRYLLGEPRIVEHRDGIALYILEYDHGLRASALGRRVQRPVPGSVCRRRLRMGHDAIS